MANHTLSMSKVSKFKVGTRVRAIQDCPWITATVKSGMTGVVFELKNAYGDGNGPMVEFENGSCGNVYDDDVEQI